MAEERERVPDAMRVFAFLCCARAFRAPPPRGRPALRAAAEPRAAPEGWSTAAGPASTLIAGGGPCGLLTALALAERGWSGIRVVDRLAEPYDPADALLWSDAARFYLVGLGLRGQTALAALGAWDAVERYCAAVVGRKDWAPGARADEGVERVFTDRPVATQVIARDRLQGALYEACRAKHPERITFDWETEVDIVVTSAVEATLTRRDGSCEVLAPEFVAGCDGTARTVAMALEEVDRNVRVTRYRDDNKRVFKTVPLDLPAAWRGDINYSTRSAGGRVNFDALPAAAVEEGKKRRYCGVLLLRSDDPLAAAGADLGELRALVAASLPQFAPFVDDQSLAAIARKPASRLPGFRFVGPRVHRGDGVVLLGDAIHTVKPYFGLGANSALEDVTALQACLDAHATGARALGAFSRARAPEARALVQITRGFDRPGARGFLTFILPIILDSVFHAALPRVFGPNTIASLQRRDTFVRVRWNKRRDRALQVAALGGGLYLACLIVRAAARRALATPAARRASLAITAALALVGVAAILSAFFEAGLAPADVLTKTNSSPVASSSNEGFVTK